MIAQANERTPLAVSNKKCTMYFKGGLGVVRMVLNRCEISSGQYAQYDSALFVTYREPRKRKDRVMTQTSFPSVLIVEGVDTPEPDGMWDIVSKRESDVVTVTTQRSRYSSCDPRWQSDFDGMIDAQIASGALKVVFDGRKHNAHDRFSS